MAIDAGQTQVKDEVLDAVWTCYRAIIPASPSEAVHLDIAQLIADAYQRGAHDWDMAAGKFPENSWREARDAYVHQVIRSLLHPSPTAVKALTVDAPTHRHKKRGTEYVLIGIGKMQAESWQQHDGNMHYWSVDMREVAIYRSVIDPTEIWVRPREEFEDGRFEALTAALAGGGQ